MSLLLTVRRSPIVLTLSLTSKLALSLVALLALTAPLVAQNQSAARPEKRILAKVDDSVRTTLHGNVHPLANARNDQGAVDNSTPMQRMILTLGHSDQQEAALNDLMAKQQDKTSPLFHQWLTPAQFGQQFGASDEDIATVTAWLTSHGFTVSEIGNGRNYIEFNGTVSQVTSAFQTPIHKYAAKGSVYQANAADPSIPTALTPVVRGVLSLNNFPRQMHHQMAGTFQRDKTTGKVTRLTAPSKLIPSGAEARAALAANPDFTVPVSSGNIYAVTPYDFATIYNVTPLWNAGIDGSGQNIAVLEETDIHVDDVRAFRSIFGLPAKDPVFIVNGPDPGITSTDEEGEAVLDTEWSGAVAKGATIDFITSASTATTAGIDLSAIYAINNNVASITSLSYGFCEPQMGATLEAYYVSLWQQGAAQGISHFVSTGDSGSDGCDDGATYATSGISVSGFASTPYNTAVGGTEFLGTLVSPTTFWSPTNNATTQASALSYIPETTWNNNCTNPIFQTGALGGGTVTTYGDYANAQTACNSLAGFDANGTLETIGGSGGYSTYSTKPSWQSGLGVPADGHRDIPDVSLLASNGSIPGINNAGTQLNYYGSFYIICQEDTSTNGQSCNTTDGAFVDYAGTGGTSVSTPAFAGIMAMVNQKTNARQGLANYVLYDLYKQQVTAGTACTSAYTISGSGPYVLGTPVMPAAGCVFNDVTFGSNSAGCKKNGTNCTVSGSNSYGLLTTPTTAVPASTEAYLNTVGYDEAVGLGSVNANNLVNSWANITFVPSATTLQLSSTSFAHGTSVNATVTVTPASGGSGTPTGLIQLDTTTTPTALGSSTLSGGTVTAPYTDFPGGTYSVSAYYAGDATYASSTSSPVYVTVTPENSTLAGLVQLENESTGALSTTSSLAYGAQGYLEFTPAGASGKGTPTGSVTVTNGGAPYAVLPLANGTAQLSTVFFAPGTYSFTGNYSGDSSFGTSTSSAVALTINKAVTKSSSITASSTSPAAGAPVTLTVTMYGSTSLANGDDFGNGPTGTVSFYAGGTSGTLLGTVPFTSSTVNTSTDVNQSIATLTTSALPYSTTTTTANSVSAVYNGDSNYTAITSASKTITVAKATKTATTNTLTAVSNPIAFGGSTNVTAALTYTSGNTPSGTVSFYVDGILYGSAVTLNAGSAGTTLTGLTAGGHTITAVYSGDTNFLGSTGALSETVSQSTSDALSLSANGVTSALVGGQVSFTGTVSFTGSTNPTGSITFTVDGTPSTTIAVLPIYTGGVGATFSTNSLALGTHTITATYSGDKNFAAATAPSSVSVNIVSGEPRNTLSGYTNVGATSSTLTATVVINTSGTLNTISVVSQTTSGSDFAFVSGGSCTANTEYTAGNTCSVQYVFTPTKPYLRAGAITLTDASGNLLGIEHVSGIGVAPQIAFASTTAAVGSGFSIPFGSAVDGAGNVYVADLNATSITEIIAASGYTTTRSLGSGFSDPAGVAVDVLGNVYVADFLNNAVKEIVAVNGSIPANPTIRTLGSGFKYPSGVAVDGGGDVFVADQGNSAIKEIVATNGIVPSANPRMYTIGTGFNQPAAVAFDNIGNLYVADTYNGAVKELTLQDGFSTTLTLGSGFGCPFGVAADGNGNVYVADTCNSAAKEILAVNGSIPASPTIVTLGTGITGAYGIAADNFGTVYVMDAPSHAVKQISTALPPTLNYGSVNDGVSATKSVLVTNVGFSALTQVAPGMSGLTTGEFTQVAGSGTPADCTGTLAAGASCNLSIAFAPTGTANGLYSDTYTLVDNNLNTSPSASQTINLVGTAAVVTSTPPGGGGGGGGGTNTTSTATITITQAGTLNAISVLTMGATGLDFQPAAPTGPVANLCSTGTTYSIGQSCVVPYSFQALYVGARNGGITLTDANGNTLGSTYLSGTGSGTLTTYAPGTTSTLNNSFGRPYGVALDGNANAYVADLLGTTVTEVVAAGGYTTTKTIVGGLNAPTGVAVDGLGNVFVSDQANNLVKEVLAVAGVIPASPTVVTVGSGLLYPMGLAVDGAGNVYVADQGNNAVKQVLAAGGYTTVNTLGSGFHLPAGVAVDGAGNVYVADTYNSAVKEIVAGTGTVTTLGSGFDHPFGVAVDALGNVYVADTYNNAFKKIVAVSGAVPANPTINTVGQGLGFGFSITLDPGGDIFVADGPSHAVKEVNLTTPQ